MSPAYWVLQKRVMPNTSRPEYHVHGKDWRPFDSLEQAQETATELTDAMDQQRIEEPLFPWPSYTFTVVVELDPSAPHREQGAP